MKYLTFILFTLIFYSQVIAQFSTELTASGAQNYDNFGYAVAISGNTAMVGAFGGGFVNFFEKTGGGWNQTTKVTASDPTVSYSFGSSVAIDGDYAIIGASNDNGMGAAAGAIYIFERTPEGWLQQQKIYSSNAMDYANFGYKVAISGNWLVVGAPNESNNGKTTNGAVYVYKMRNNHWQYYKTLTANDSQNNDNFGYSVDIDQNYIAAGATGDDDNGSASGSVYLFSCDGGWAQVAKLTATDGNIGDSFGNSVAIQGKQLIAGAKSNDEMANNAGAAYLFREQQGEWTELAKITAFDAAAGDAFGNAVDIYGDRILIGAVTKYVGTIYYAGSAYLYQVNNRDQVVLQKKLLKKDAVNYDNFGYDVALGERFMIVGVPNSDLNSSTYNTGSAFVYDGDYNAPIIDSGLDVPDDEGGFVTLTWEASLLDNAAHDLNYYSIWRALPSGSIPSHFETSLPGKLEENNLYRYASVEGVNTAFEKVGQQQAHFLQQYSFTAPTLYDQSATNSGDHIFMVSYQTADPTVFYDSEPITAHSVDNIPPPMASRLDAEIIDGAIEISWPASEAVDLSHYQLYRGTNESPLAAYTTTKETHFMDNNVQSGKVYYYSVSAIDSSGNESETCSPDSVTFSVTGLNDLPSPPLTLDLLPNYPNPFNPVTTITMHIAKAGPVRLDVYDSRGSLVANLSEKTYQPGIYNVTWNASSLASGIYYIRLQEGAEVRVQKGILIK